MSDVTHGGLRNFVCDTGCETEIGLKSQPFGEISQTFVCETAAMTVFVLGVPQSSERKVASGAEIPAMWRSQTSVNRCPN